MRCSIVVLAWVAAACSHGERAVPAAQAEGGRGRHAYVWAEAADSTGSDALLVYDMDSASASFGRLVAELPVGAAKTMPHHIERLVSADGRLLANSWSAGTTWVLDVGDPAAPSVAASFREAGGIIGWAHDFARLPGGHALVAFNAGAGAYAGPGGLAEVAEDGSVVQAARATMTGIPGVGDTAFTPYALTPLPDRPRALVALGEMGLGPDFKYHATAALQLWRTDSLAPIAFVPLPPNGRDEGHVAASSVEVMPSGAVFANTFLCGLFRVDGLAEDRPVAVRVHTFPGGPNEEYCAVAATVGSYWIQAVAALPGLVVLDLADPAQPREVSRLVLDRERFPHAHWVSASRDGRQLALTGHGGWLAFARFDPATGAVSLDERLRDAEGQPGLLVRSRAGGTMQPHGVAWD